MTLAPLPIRRARKVATAIHDRLRIRDAADIDVEGIAALHGLDVRRGGLHGADARLVGTGGIGIIRLSTRIDHEGAQRFSVAHELRHRQLAHRSTALPSCEPAPLHVERGAEAEAIWGLENPRACISSSRLVAVSSRRFGRAQLGAAIENRLPTVGARQ